MITFAGPTEDAFNLATPVAGAIRDAEVRGNSAVLRSYLGVTAASRAVANNGAAFESATKYLVANMLRSMAKKLEIEMFYGQMGYGTITGSPSGLEVTIATAEWAPGIWAGAENMPIEIRSSSGTLRGTTSVAAVDMNARVLTLDSMPVGTGNGDVIWHATAYGKEFPGVHKILTQSSGPLFNIEVGEFSVWQGNEYPAGSAALSFAKLNLAAARAVEKGQDGKLRAYCSTRGWANMLTDQAALRQYDSSYSTSKLENGAQRLTFFSQNGEIEIVPSIYVKEGYAYLLSMDDWMRVGSQDISFQIPGRSGEFFRLLENSNAYELRLFTDQALFCSAPGKSVIITGIVNAS